MTGPSPYSKEIPNLQLAWDATSLRSLMTCPRAYKYSIVDGWRSTGVDVEFGGYFASAVEVFRKARLAGDTKSQAQLKAVRYAIEATWIRQLGCGDKTLGGPGNKAAVEEDIQGEPWGGHYEEQWRCTGTEPYRNGKGNRAKCPWSHMGRWFPEPAPHTCGSCGSPTETQRRWLPNDQYKDRYTLVRLVVWYTDEQPEKAEDGVSAISFPDGTPAVELSFAIPLPFSAGTGEPFVLAGHMDSIIRYGNEHFIADNKTTKKVMGQGYWGQYAPNVQVDVYDLVGNLLFPSLDIRGVMIEGAQVLQDGARFAIHPFYHHDSQREELLKEIEFWLGQAEKYARDDYWPMNRASCYMCPFKVVCSKEPVHRETLLKGLFEQRKWNPLETR